MTTLEDKGRHAYGQHTLGRTESKRTVETMPLPTKSKPNEKLSHGRKKRMREQRRRQGGGGGGAGQVEGKTRERTPRFLFV